MARRPTIPAYRLHKQSGQAVVTLSDGLGRRRDVLLGPYATPESRAEYACVITEWEANGRRLPPPVSRCDLSVNELVLLFLGHAEGHYRHADGSPTSEVADFKLSLRPLRELYGLTRAADFGPLALKALRERLVEGGLSRGVINQRIGRIKRMFRWAVENELVSPSVYHALQAVQALKRGRSGARETEPVSPVVDEYVEAVLPHLTRPLRGLVLLQRLTGMRPGEAAQMRACDLDMTGQVWLYRPARHKAAWRNRGRVIAIGPKAQRVIREYLKPDPDAYLFSPKDGREEWFAAKRAARKTKVQPSQACRRKAHPKRRPGELYTRTAYASAVARACGRAGVPAWHPNQLRHSHATEVRRRYGLEAAQVALGHSKADVTQVYAERDLSLAGRVATEIG
jgi:integrase